MIKDPCPQGETGKRGVHTGRRLSEEAIPCQLRNLLGQREGLRSSRLYLMVHADFANSKGEKELVADGCSPTVLPKPHFTPNQKHAPSRATNTNTLSANRTWEGTPFTLWRQS